ncbi:hypothetical protein AB0F36_09285 [Streptomyces sp. NPDC029080]|uniref:hypothetical protein n=1 Tax=Streptomyces sp. NPDC029080 TaxID=3155017 RepID=UPI00144E792D|nr:hypothetical protein [Streptomyces sp. SID2955]
MTKPEAFNVLRGEDGGEDGGELVVVADFAATGRQAATFHDLVKLLDTTHTVWETAPVPWGQEAGMTGADQAERWLDGIRDSGLKVRALLGFCGGGIYAGIMADRIAQWQDRPRLVLFDPGFAERRMLTEHVEGFYRRLAKAFTEEQLAAGRRRVAEASAAPGALELADRLGALFHEELRPAIVRAGWSERAADDGADLVNGYLHWLAGAVDLDPRPAWRAADVLNSATPGIGLHIIPESERPAMFGTTRFFDVPHGDLLRTAEVAEAADALLAGSARPRADAQK